MIILYNIATPYNVSNISSFFAFVAGRNRPWVGKRGLLLMTCNTILALLSMSWTYIHGIHSIIRNHMQYMLVLTRAKIQHLWKSHAWMYAKLENTGSWVSKSKVSDKVVYDCARWEASTIWTVCASFLWPSTSFLYKIKPFREPKNRTVLSRSNDLTNLLILQCYFAPTAAEKVLILSVRSQEACTLQSVTLSETAQHNSPMHKPTPCQFL